VTTVGYGDLVPEDDAGQQMFVACYAFLGVAFLATIISEVIKTLVQFTKQVVLRARLKAMQDSRLLVEHHLRMKSGSNLLPRIEENSVRAKEIQLLKYCSTTAQRIGGRYRHYKRKYGALLDLGLLAGQLVAVWFVGAAILLTTEGFTLTESVYCAVITSLSVGYGDYYPVTQTGRLAFAFYIPLSVTIVMGCVGQLVGVTKDYFTVHAVTRAPMTKIFDLDQDKDGEVSEAEYVLFMLAETREIDPLLLAGFKAQFRALDQDKSGALSEADFPEMLEVETTTVVYRSQIESVAWKVVPKKGSTQENRKCTANFVPMEGRAHHVVLPPTTLQEPNTNEPTAARRDIRTHGGVIPPERNNPAQWLSAVAENASTGVGGGAGVGSTRVGSTREGSTREGSTGVAHPASTIASVASLAPARQSLVFEQQSDSQLQTSVSNAQLHTDIVYTDQCGYGMELDAGASAGQMSEPASGRMWV
jgi:hypothetical protein